MRLVHHSVYGRQPNHLGLGSPDHRPEEAWPALRELAVDPLPGCSGTLAPAYLSGVLAKLKCRPEAFNKWGLVQLMPVPAERQLLGTLHQKPEEAVGKAVGLLGLVQVPQKLLFGDVADQRDVRSGRLRRAVLGQGPQTVAVPCLPQDHT